MKVVQFIVGLCVVFFYGLFLYSIGKICFIFWERYNAGTWAGTKLFDLFLSLGAGFFLIVMIGAIFEHILEEINK